jgi:hypothetical protein
MKEEDSWDDLLTGNKRNFFCPDLFPAGESEKKEEGEEDKKSSPLPTTLKGGEQLMKRKAEKNLESSHVGLERKCPLFPFPVRYFIFAKSQSFISKNYFWQKCANKLSLFCFFCVTIFHFM